MSISSSDEEKVFAYSKEFEDAIHRMIDDPPGSAAHEHWFRMAQNRVDFQRSHFLPTILRFSPLAGKRGLEIGCGTGPSTVVMAEAGASVIALDVDPRMTEAASLRIRYHGLAHAAQARWVERTDALAFPDEHFDLIVVNGVMEHVRPEMRAAILRELWRVLHRGGQMFIGETPNRLWPIDDHTTGLWWVHYLPAACARRYALLRKRIKPADDMFARGAFGCTYRGLMKALPRNETHVLNAERPYSWLEQFHHRLLNKHGVARGIGWFAYVLLAVVQTLILEPVFDMPLDGLMPYLSLAIEKVLPIL